MKRFLPLIGVLAVASTVFGAQAYFIAAMVLLSVVLLIVNKSAATVAYPISAGTVVAFSCYGKAADFGGLFYLIIPLTGAFIYNIVRYKKRITGGFPKTHLMNSMIAVAIAVLLGGVGQSETMPFFGIGAYYYLGLSVLPIGLYFLTLLLSDGSDRADEARTLLDAVYFAGIVASSMMLAYYAVCIREFASTWNTLSFLVSNPIRNLAAIFLIPTSAMSVLRARRAKVNICVTVLVIISALLSSSRSAFLFSVFAMLVTLVGIMIVKAKHKKRTAVIACIISVAVFGAVYYAYEHISSRVGYTSLLSSDIRVSLWKRGLADFAEAPIVGKGILYTGNSSYFSASAKDFEIGWYHNLFAEVLGAFGIFGVLAYGYQLYVRGKVCIGTLTGAPELTAVYMSMLMLSFTEPGIFCPFPTSALLAVLFALTEHPPAKKPKRKTHKSA